MNGRITIDGHYRNGHYETVVHGGEPDPEALCSLTMSVHHHHEVEELLSIMKSYVRRCINMELDAAIIARRDYGEVKGE